MEHAAFAVRKCPFLAQLAKEHGEEFATAIAIAPTKPVGSEPLPTGTDAVCGLAESFRLFHGPQGVIPLTKGSKASSAFDGSRAGCPFHAGAKKGPSASASEPSARAVPFATISLSNFGKGPNFGDFLRKQLDKGKGQRPHSNQQRPQRPNTTHSNAGQPPRGPASTSTGNASSNGTFGGSSNMKPQRPLGDPSAPKSSGPGRALGSSSHSKPPGAAGSSYSGGSSSSSTLNSRGGAIGPSNWTTTANGSGSSAPSPFQQQRLGTNSSSSSRGHSGSGADSTGGRGVRGSSGGTLSNSSGSGAPSGCPLRKWLGPAAGLVFNQYDKLVCPPPIVAARAALSKTAAVQQLRPQALPVKLVAVAAVVAGVNIPCGAVREHFEKFSLGWFVAVHATIPFVAMLRKAVIMPKYAMVVTIAAAVLGQMVGSRLERMRLRYEEQHGPLLPLSLQLPLQPISLLDSAQPAASEDSSSSGLRLNSAGRGRTSGGHHLDSGSSNKGASSASHRDQRWREKLAAEPVPAVDSLSHARCGGPMPGGLFARLPLVKA